MAKIHKMFCIDSELGERLIDINGSALVNELLLNHFGTTRKAVEKRRIKLEKELGMVQEESDALRIVEDETEEAQKLREKKEALVKERKEKHDIEKRKLVALAKAKKIPFEEFLEASKELKRKWSI